MPRTSRAVAVGYPHHVTQRGNNREQVFFDDQDRRTYLEFLRHYTQKHQVDIWAYCLIPNHIHVLAVPHVSDGLAVGVGLSNQSYTRYKNRKYLRSGRVWQNRFYSCIVDTDDYLWSVARYIEYNPVKANLVTDALAYHWSSARHHLAGVRDPLLVNSSWLNDDARDDYRSFLLDSDDRMSEAIRQATRRGRPFCSTATLAHLETLLDRSLC
jgi:putative transposase